MDYVVKLVGCHLNGSTPKDPKTTTISEKWSHNLVENSGVSSHAEIQQKRQIAKYGHRLNPQHNPLPHSTWNDVSDQGKVQNGEDEVSESMDPYMEEDAYVIAVVATENGGRVMVLAVSNEQKHDRC